MSRPSATRKARSVGRPTACSEATPPAESAHTLSRERSAATATAGCERGSSRVAPTSARMDGSAAKWASPPA
eukprot:1581960-Prymnesium_polylepis.1